MDPDRRSALYDLKRKLRRSQSDDVFQGFMRLGSYSAIAAAALFILHLVMARWLGPADYASYGTYVAILFTAFFALTSIHLIITRFVSYHRSRFQYEQINYIVTKSLKRVFLIGAALFVLILLFSPQISAFFGLTSSIPTVVLGFVLWFTLLVPVFEGAYKGMEDFELLGKFRVGEAVSRLILAIVLVWMGFGVAGALFGLGLGTFIGLAISYKHIYRMQKKKSVRPNTDEMKKFAIPVLLTMGSIALLLNADIILVKHFFPATEAGVFAAASLIAKVPFLVSMIFLGVMFPKITRLHADGKNSAPVLKHALQTVTPIVALFTLLGFFVARPLTAGIFGAEYALGPVLGFYIFGMGCLGLIVLLAVYMLAVRIDHIAYTLPFIVLAFIGLLVWAQSSLLAIIVVVMLVMSATLAYMLFVARNILEFDYFL